MRAQIGRIVRDGGLQPITRDTNRYATLTLSADGKSASSVQVKTTRSFALASIADLARPDFTLKTLPVADPRIVQWTSDSKLLVVSEDKVTRVDADGQNATVLVSDPSAGILSLSQCSDRYLLLSWAFHEGRTINIWRTNADGSAPKQLTSQFFDTDPMCSPDGKWVYYFDRPETKLMRVSIDGGKSNVVPSEVTNRFALNSIDFISSDGRYLSMGVHIMDPATNDSRTELETINLDANTKSAPQLKPLDHRFGQMRNFSPRVQLMPDGKAVVYAINENGKRVEAYFHPVTLAPIPTKQ